MAIADEEHSERLATGGGADVGLDRLDDRARVVGLGGSSNGVEVLGHLDDVHLCTGLKAVALEHLRGMAAVQQQLAPGDAAAPQIVLVGGLEVVGESQLNILHRLATDVVALDQAADLLQHVENAVVVHVEAAIAPEQAAAGVKGALGLHLPELLAGRLPALGVEPEAADRRVRLTT